MLVDFRPLVYCDNQSVYCSSPVLHLKLHQMFVAPYFQKSHCTFITESKFMFLDNKVECIALMWESFELTTAMIYMIFTKHMCIICSTTVVGKYRIVSSTMKIYSSGCFEYFDYLSAIETWSEKMEEDGGMDVWMEYYLNNNI